MKYLLDFDHTLLDTAAFIAQVKKDGRGDIRVTPGIWEFYNVRDFLYDDVLDWFNSKSKESLHILSAMTPELGPESCEFQKEKVSSGNFSGMVESVTLMIGMKGEPAASIAQRWTRHELVIFIDDRLDQCLSVKAALPESFCFLMVREGHFPSPLPPGITAVSTLAEVDAIMKRRL
jgi:hypothetical protein